jgi:hypothetical protein
MLQQPLIFLFFIKNVENIITLEGHVIDKRIRKVALDGYGLQV